MVIIEVEVMVYMVVVLETHAAIENSEVITATIDMVENRVEVNANWRSFTFSSFLTVVINLSRGQVDITGP
jgi:hypothetical protein